MSSVQLYQMLNGLLEGLDASQASYLAVTEAEVSFPIEIRLIEREGMVSFSAGPPHSIWKSGFEPTIHHARLLATLLPIEEVVTNPDTGGASSHGPGR